MFKKALFIFRRDLRLDDNTGLNFALEYAKTVIPCFIFTPEQIDYNPYRSNRCLQFMIESLEDLSSQLASKHGKLFLFFGNSEEIVFKSIKTLAIDAVVVNRDYTPYSIKRDERIAAVCQHHQISFHSCDDALLQPPENTLKSNGKPYTIFTPFYRNALKLSVMPPQTFQRSHFFTDTIDFSETSDIYQQILPKRVDQLPGGRQAALEILQKLSRFASYETDHDFPSRPGTTHLSPHLKFTTCSPREIYQAICDKLGPHSELIRSLFWRDFFTSIAFFFPHVFQGAFHQKFDAINWNSDNITFKKWCDGKTGFPLVDAGMRELNQTGYMHNRVRMVVASFLIKDLHINWQWGEKYFAQTLLDYDPAVNNGNWQWAASTGCDAQPYFRIFNPWNQQKKFDPDCLYIKQWIPELAHFTAKQIHAWEFPLNHNLCPSYPPPLVDHAVESKIALQMYKNC